MRRISFIILTISLFAAIGFSQPNSFRWSPPDLKDLYMKKCPYDSNASAMILSEYGKIYFADWRSELRMFYEINRRIKIFKSPGKKYAHFERVYYRGYDNFEEFASVKAFIYTIQNGRPVKKRLKRKFIQRQKLGHGFYKLVIDFPDARPGDILEYRLSFTTFLFASPQPWYFQHDIPTRYSQFDLVIPQNMRYFFNIVGKDYLVKNIADQGITTIEHTGTYNDQIPPGLDYPSSSISGTFLFKLNCMYYTFAMKDIPQFYPEKYLDNPKNYYYQVQPMLYYVDQNYTYFDDLQDYIWKKFSKRLFLTLEPNYKPMTRSQAAMNFYPAGYVMFNATDWQLFAQKMRRNADWYLQMMKFIPGSPSVAALTQNQQTEKQKITAIYKWIKNNISWNHQYNAFNDHSLQRVIREKSGNSAEINMLFINLLRKAGIKAYPVLVKTVDRGHLIGQVAASYQFNHLIALIKYDNQSFAFDLISDKPSILLDSNDHNQVGFVIEQDTAYFYQLNDPVQHINSYVANLTLENNSLTGSITHTLTGRLMLDSTLIGLENNFNNLNNTKIKTTAKSLDNSKLTVKYSINSTALARNNDSLLLIQPFAIYKILHNIFDSYSRTYPVYLFNTSRIQIQTTITLDGNYQLIKPLNTSNQIDGAELTLKSALNGNKLKLDLTFSLDKYYFTKREFSELYNLYEQLSNLKNAMIVLKKK